MQKKINLNLNLGAIIALIICIVVLFSPHFSSIYKYIAFAGIIYLSTQGGK